jgi:hypothetical protein
LTYCEVALCQVLVRRGWRRKQQDTASRPDKTDNEERLWHERVLAEGPTRKGHGTADQQQHDAGGEHRAEAQIAFQAGGAILAEAGLSFLGAWGSDRDELGARLGSAQRFVREAWWMSIFPCIGITLTVLGVQSSGGCAGAQKTDTA